MEQLIAGRGISKARATAISVELDRIHATAGTVTPRSVVKAAAKSPQSALWREFDRHGLWNDKVAAHKARLLFAGDLIRSVRVVIRKDPDDKPRSIRAFVSVVSPHGRGYVPYTEAFSVDEYREQLFANALAELRSFKEKYRTLSQLAPVFAAIERVSTKRRKKAA